MISRLQGKASRTLVESRGLPSDSTCVLETEPGKLDIKRCESGILFISVSIVSLFKLDYDVNIDFCVDLATLFKKYIVIMN